MSEQTVVPASAAQAVLLVVERDEFYRDTIAYELADSGFAVFTAAGADDALRRAPALPPIDVLVSARDLDGAGDGVLLTARLRELNPTVKALLYGPRLGEEGASPETVLLREPLTVTALRSAIARLLEPAPPHPPAPPSNRAKANPKNVVRTRRERGRRGRPAPVVPAEAAAQPAPV